MKKAIFIFLAMLLFTVQVRAEADIPDPSKLWNDSGFSDLYGELDDSTQNILSYWGIDKSVDGLSSFSAEGIIHWLCDWFLSSGKTPIKALAGGVTVLFLCSICVGFGTDEKAPDEAVSLFCSAALTAIILIPALHTVNRSAEAIQAAGRFLIAFLPAFAAILLLMQRSFIATKECGVVFTFGQVLIYLSSHFLVPLVTTLFAMAAAAGIGNCPAARKTVFGIRKILNWVLGGAMSLFTGTLAISGIVGGAADSIKQRAARFLIGSGVPVVGGAISDSLSALQGCFALLKSGAGAFGVAVIAAIFVPVMLELFLWRLAAMVLSVTADLLGIKTAEDAITAISDGIRVLFSVVISCGVASVVSLAILMLCGGNG